MCWHYHQYFFQLSSQSNQNLITHLVACALMRAPALQNAEIEEHFSRKRIDVHSASSEQMTD
jgi:hypothetical protein